ncbi:hypothetical protein GH714_034823 [Hevea brasiliensis]|uniref:Uncharacterized protein n=1 Tax=Hevea brasiliensis TaxID=3981 RepID=A0A6A6M2Y2_HEVBR|nr:hypothetical protein GH714_034823 [Hevea brasiliensis]
MDTWKEMFNVFANEDFQALCSTNTNNRASQRIIASTGPTPFAQVEYDMMDEELGEVPYASEVWMATHGFLDEQGQTQWHDLESSRIYEEMQRIEKQPTSDNEIGPTPDDVLKEVFGVRSGYVHGKRLGYKASTRGMACGYRNEELNELRRRDSKVECSFEGTMTRNNEIAQLNARLKEQEERNLEFFKIFESVIGYKSSESQDMTIISLGYVLQDVNGHIISVGSAHINGVMDPIFTKGQHQGSLGLIVDDIRAYFLHFMNALSSLLKGMLTRWRIFLLPMDTIVLMFATLALLFLQMFL